MDRNASFYLFTLRKIQNTFHSVDGKWGKWGNYDKCTVTCGGGTQRKTRKCNNPKPQHGGKDCEGEDYQQAECNNQECPSKLNSSIF